MMSFSKSIWRMRSGPDGIALTIDAHERGENLTARDARTLAEALIKAADRIEIDPVAVRVLRGRYVTSHE